LNLVAKPPSSSDINSISEDIDEVEANELTEPLDVQTPVSIRANSFSMPKDPPIASFSQLFDINKATIRLIKDTNPKNLVSSQGCCDNTPKFNGAQEVPQIPFPFAFRESGDQKRYKEKIKQVYWYA